MQESNSIDQKEPITIDGDQLMNILVYCAVQSQKPSIWIILIAIENTAQKVLFQCGEEAYCFATLKGAFEYLVRIGTQNEGVINKIII